MACSCVKDKNGNIIRRCGECWEKIGEKKDK